MLIADQASFDRLMPRFAATGLVAVDTEAASFHKYLDRVYLLQLSSREETVVVDPLAVPDLSAFGAMLADPGIEVVFHDADYDLRLLHQEFGFQATHLFDTRVAAQLLDEPGIGLAALLEKYLQLRIDKRFQRADWSIRPLSEEMLAYAATDTRHLAELRDIMRSRLIELGRLAWAEEEFVVMEGSRWDAEDVEPGWLRLKGARLLKPRELAVLRSVYQWRDEQAKRLDRAAFRILNNEPILAMAKAPPRDMDALKKIPGIGPDQAERRGRQLLAAVEEALALPEGQLPRIERPPRRATDPALDARLERLKLVRNRLAARYPLQPGVLCPNGTLEAIARANPSTLKDMADIPSVRRWQVAEIGTDLLAALPEPVSNPGTP
ncbi:MAG: 3-5 exonuclease [Gemmatimonadetes bacterium]|nr:3-5 exonuclease [Gemmatimonadota bacterium]